MVTRYKKYWIILFVSVIILIVGVVVIFLLHRHTWNNINYRTFKEHSIVAKKYQFQDLNATHLSAAKRNGIKPIQTRKDVGQLKINNIESCDLYMVDGLTHSVPYLTIGACNLLAEIGTCFQTELRNKGYRPHRIIVTSILRTEEDVNNLKKVNGNATANSAHLYGTTFDITYLRYNRLSLEGKPVSNQQMTDILGEVLKRLRKEGLCYVKYENRQRCFHITTRK